MNKRFRHKTIKEIIETHNITNQDTLLNILIEKGFDITQATLSRDMKELKITKTPTDNGTYIYRLPNTVASSDDGITPLSAFGFISIEFSGQLAVIKTRPGYAMAIAAEIDTKAKNTVLGTVAGDDTVLLIPRENISREDVLSSLTAFIPNIQ